MLLISVVIPVYNSEQSLEELYTRIIKVLNDLNHTFEIILVDDCSKDGSYEIMRNIRNGDNRVKIIRLGANFGQHNATLCGFHYCKGDYIVTMDDDLQNPPEEVPELLEKIKEGYDVVFGIPQKRQHAIYRNWGSALINSCLNLIFHKPWDIKSSSYRILRKDIVEKIVAQPLTDVYLAALILEITSNIANVSVRHDSRKYGKTNYNLKKSIKLAARLLINYSYLPLKILSFIWQLLLVFAIVFVLMIAANGINSEEAIKGVIAIFLLIISGLSTVSVILFLEYIKKLDKKTAKTKEPYVISDKQI